MNIQFIHGRFTRDPEFTNGDSPEKDRCKFTVASDRRFGEKANFLNCVIFGKRAAVIDKFFHKGSEIVLIAEEQTESYMDKNGNKRTSYSNVVIDFDFCGSKSDAPKQEEPEPKFEEIDEEIPF